MARSDAAPVRAAVLSQLQHLVDEAGATRALAARLPLPVLELRPAPDGRSIKELYGVLASWDSEVFLPLVRRMACEDVPRHDAPAPAAAPWQARPICEILDRVCEARQALVAFVRDLPAAAWSRQGILWGKRYDMYGLLHMATQHTTDRLRAVAGQLNACL